MKANYFVIVWKMFDGLTAEVFTTKKARNEYLNKNYFDINDPQPTHNKPVGVPYDVNGMELTNKMMESTWRGVQFH